VNDKIRKRARALARHAAEEGPEGEGAKRRLDTLIQKHPDLAYMLEDGAAEYDTITVSAPTPVHVELLDLLAASRDCEVTYASVAGDDPALVQWSLSGLRADIHRTMDAYNAHGDALLSLFGQIGRSYLGAVFAAEELASEERSEPDEDQLSRLIADLMSATTQPTPYEVYVAAQRQRLNALEAKMPRFAIAALCAKLVQLAATIHSEPSLLLGERTVVWNDPDLSFEDFLASHQAMIPNSAIEETSLGFLYRDGYRLYPPTRRLRLCRELTKDADWVPESWR